MKTKRRQSLCGMATLASGMILDSFYRFSNSETSLPEKVFLLKNILAWLSIIETIPKIKRLACIKYIRHSYNNVLHTPIGEQTNSITFLLGKITKRIESIQGLRNKP